MVEVSIATESELDDFIDLFQQIDRHCFGAQAPSRKLVAGYARSNLLQPHRGVRVVLARADLRRFARDIRP